MNSVKINERKDKLKEQKLTEHHTVKHYTTKRDFFCQIQRKALPFYWNKLLYCVDVGGISTLQEEVPASTLAREDERDRRPPPNVWIDYKIEQH